MESPRENIQLPAGQTFRLLRWDRSVSRVEVVHAPDRTERLRGHGDHWHYHIETELTYIQRGAGTRFVADIIEPFESGDLVLIGANVPHYWHLRGASAGLSLQWSFPLEHGIWGFGEAAALARLEDLARRGVCLRGTTAAMVTQAMQSMSSLAGLARLATFLRLLAHLAEAPRTDVRLLSAKPFSLTGTAEQQEAIRRAVSYTIAHQTESIRLPELLRLTHMSRATFARQFKRHTGKAFSEFFNEVRLQTVCRKLRESTEPVSAIALGSGFNQLSFFNRLFQRHFGRSPSEYRVQHQQPRRHTRGR